MRLAARGEGGSLVSMAVDDLEAEVAAMRERGERLLGDPGPGQPITGVVFVHPRETKGVLTQLVQWFDLVDQDRGDGKRH